MSIIFSYFKFLLMNINTFPLTPIEKGENHRKSSNGMVSFITWPSFISKPNILVDDDFSMTKLKREYQKVDFQQEKEKSEKIQKERLEIDQEMNEIENSLSKGPSKRVYM